ncbi:hypothetical protein NPIL_672331 [Nephila pilipes]|uniref:Uncharacterized protein n=1 Tax=Nephila pilipes TaxID=299642 RepID=A0A8X6IPS2_NEPPI|nr:hypothetical protein NPIL_672331 [Nephila pilipes]
MFWGPEKSLGKVGEELIYPLKISSRFCRNTWNPIPEENEFLSCAERFWPTSPAEVVMPLAQKDQAGDTHRPKS